MEPQKAFDTMVTHLRKQGEQSKVSEGTKCLYRSDMGLKCAVGCLIPDGDYDPEMEETMQGFKHFPVFNGWPEGTLDIMSSMQFVHDSSDDWELSFRGVARSYKLTLAPKP